MYKDKNRGIHASILSRSLSSLCSAPPGTPLCQDLASRTPPFAVMVLTGALGEIHAERKSPAFLQNMSPEPPGFGDSTEYRGRGRSAHSARQTAERRPAVQQAPGDLAAEEPASRRCGQKPFPGSLSGRSPNPEQRVSAGARGASPVVHCTPRSVPDRNRFQIHLQ